MQGTKHAHSAAHFIADCAKRYKGEVTVLALGPLTNIALAVQLDADLISQLVGHIAGCLAP